MEALRDPRRLNAARSLLKGASAATERCASLLGSGLAPAFFGSLTVLEVVFVWGGLSQVAVVHDEAAYLLQAKIFATGHWTAPAPPLPEFFEQYQVLVTPVLAGKYPPGHPLLLVPGIWLGLPGLMPVVLAGLAGGLVFLLARRFANPWVALLTWMIWTTSPGNLRVLPSYLSQNTTVVLWLAGWWALSRWVDTGDVGWLVALAACVAWGILTRPFTMAGYAAAAAFVVSREIRRRRAWRQLMVAALPIACALAIILIWSARTTGSIWTTPYALYSRIYFPFQRPGFGLPATTEPLRTLPPDMARYSDWYRGLHAAHTTKSIPVDLFERLRGIERDTWGAERQPLSLPAIFGLFVLPPEGVFALTTGALLILAHIPFAHPWPWSIYYMELQAPLAFATALGLWVTICVIAARSRTELRAVARAVTPAAALFTALLTLAFVVPARIEILRARGERLQEASYFDSFRSLVAAIPAQRAIVFVRYGPDHFPPRSLIANEPDLARARRWVVYDRGAEDSKLMAIAPDRAAYLYDEATGRLTRR